MQKVIIENWANLNGIKISEEQFEKLSEYQQRVLEVNKYMNLTRITDEKDFAVKHIIDSLTLLPYLKEGKLLDIGTGAGFPGLVLRIMRENIDLTLLDSLRKRIIFLQETAEMLNIPVKCVHARAEDYAKKHAKTYDICTARAVASLDKLAGYALPFLKKDGIFLAMKGREISEELENAKPFVKKYGGEIEKTDIVLLSDEIKHSVILIRKIC